EASQQGRRSFRGLGAQEVPWWGCESGQEEGASALPKPGRCGLTDLNSILASNVMRILMSSFNQPVGIGGWNASSNNLELALSVLLQNGQDKYTTTNFFLNLAMANLCFIICCVPFQGTIYTLDGWLFGAFACKAVHFLIYLTMYASSFTLAAVSIDR
uniref:G-protein coupled receptors family 1 profile domain-containing protein n=1 Tax=Bubo bubo TaxID=30461 RepID=A0A8C0IAT3_BUBBB